MKAILSQARRCHTEFLLIFCNLQSFAFKSAAYLTALQVLTSKYDMGSPPRSGFRLLFVLMSSFDLAFLLFDIA